MEYCANWQNVPGTVTNVTLNGPANLPDVPGTVTFMAARPRGQKPRPCRSLDRAAELKRPLPGAPLRQHLPPAASSRRRTWARSRQSERPSDRAQAPTPNHEGRTYHLRPPLGFPTGLTGLSVGFATGRFWHN